MSETVNSPIVALLEDRPKQGMVFQLNLSVYLDARVVFVNGVKELTAAMATPEGVQLVIARASFKGGSVAEKVAEQALFQKIPLISIAGKEREGVVVVEDNTVKPMLQAAARILGITAQHMVDKTRPDVFEIAPEFLNMLFSAPCKIFRRGSGGQELVFGAGEIISREKIKKYIESDELLVIDVFHRLRLANAVTEQNLSAAKDLSAQGVSSEKKMALLASSLEMVAAQFKSAGMDSETIDLANSSIKAIEQIANSSTSLGSLVKQLMQTQGGYRYAHSQLLTFLGFHVIKMMGWWGDDQRAIISQAAFYHDISLGSDEEAKVCSMEGLKTCGIEDPQKLEEILTHAQLSARELQSLPEVSPEVVRVVIQHHGSSIGKGFSTDISKLENLSKAFLLSEAWADYLIGLSDSEKVPDNSAKLAELKSIYKDDMSQQIIETFRYLDPEQFQNDFLEAPDFSLAEKTESASFAEALVSGSASVEEAATAALNDAGTKAKLEAIRLKKAKKTEDEADASKVFGAEEATAVQEKNISGTVNAPLSEEIFVKGQAEDETEVTVKGEKAVPVQKKKISGTTDVRLDEEILIKGEPGAEDETEVTIKGEKAAAVQNRKIDGVTDVRSDEEILIKGEKNAKDLIDRSIVKLKADTPEAQRELKMKALAGATDIMKAALGGAFDAVSGLIASAENLGVELRKTDADGRAAIHYAAMGGSAAVLKLLLEKGAQMNSVDAKRRSPLFLSALHKQNDAFDFLLSQGAKIGQQAMGGMTIAMIGAFSGNLHVLEAAVEKKVRLDTKDHTGKTVIDYAKQGKNAAVLAYLASLEKKALGAAA